MKEKMTLTTVTFKNDDKAPEKEQEIPTINAAVSPKAAPAATPTTDSRCIILAVSLGIVCVFLVISISVNIHFGVLTNQKQANIYELTAELELLLDNKSDLERSLKEVNDVKDELTRTLGFILTFDNFPVTEYCPNKQCQPCRRSWLVFQEKCYYFHESPDYAWRSWQGSREFCQNQTADLVVVDNLEEQEFLSNNTKPYYDKFHGFWLGLEQTTNEDWVWIDGRNDTLGFWMKEVLGKPGPCALMIPGRNLTDSWDPAECNFLNKFICESDALVRSNN